MMSRSRRFKNFSLVAPLFFPITGFIEKINDLLYDNISEVSSHSKEYNIGLRSAGSAWKTSA
jgi:hypothetical protein